MTLERTTTTLRIFEIAEQIRIECGNVISTDMIEKCEEAAKKHGLTGGERHILCELLGI